MFFHKLFLFVYLIINQKTDKLLTLLQNSFEITFFFNIQQDYQFFCWYLKNNDFREKQVFLSFSLFYIVQNKELQLQITEVSIQRLFVTASQKFLAAFVLL